MKAILVTWREINHEEYQDFVHMIPDPEEAMIMQKLKGSAVMTNTYIISHKTNRLLAQIVDGHLLFCHHHQRNVWVKNMLDVISNYVSTLIKDNIEEIAPELCVSPRFENMCRAFDKELSLCANYPKGWGSNFCQLMKENHSGELLFHVERACKGRMDVVLMESMAIYCNCNYYVDFINEMISYCGWEDNILAYNQMMLLSSVEFAAFARLWYIFHLAIIMPMRWLASKTLKLAHCKWGYISMGNVMDDLKEDLQSIVNTPELIH